MGFLQRIFGQGSAPAAAPSRTPPPSASPHPSAHSTRGAGNSPQSVRKELVRVSTRDTLLHNGIPPDWVRAEPLTSAAPGREPGVHVRLVVQHWDPRLMVHAVALQQNIEKRILAMDPDAEQWMMGISWLFALKDDTACPPLPHPGTWTAPATAALSRDNPASEPGADVISGPTRITGSDPGVSARAELERMLSERDTDFRKDGGGSFEATQPMKL